MGGRIRPGDGLQPAGQHLKRIEYAGDRLKQKHHPPGQHLRLLPEPHDQRRGQHPDRPAGHDQVEDERDERQADHEDVVGIEHQGRHDHHDRDRRDLEHAHGHRGRQELARLQRTREQVHQVPGPDLFQEGDRDALLRAKQHIPQDQRTEEESHDAWQLPLKSHQIDRNEPPYDQVQERPVKNLHQPRQTAPVQIQMPSQQRNDAVQLHLFLSLSPKQLRASV